MCRVGGGGRVMVLTSVTGSPVVFGFAPLYSVALVSVLQELLCGICVRTVDKPDQNIKTCKTITTMTTKENTEGRVQKKQR